ncbi:MAG: tetratricopeptide repeat protein [Chloroflexaceae bacterium]|nr:tetratricopeptide repeat protein [Chloroflexaceae bacterium]
MARPHIPPSYYLRRAVACYEHAGEAHAAAEVLAEGDLPDITEAARRFAALGDLSSAGEAYLKAGQPRPALDCFRRAHMVEGELRCLLALEDSAHAGALLLEMQRPAEAIPHLEQALQVLSDAVPALRAQFQLAQALVLTGQHDAASQHYRDAHPRLLKLPATAASAPAWVALGDWGLAARRQDRMQEGYAEALRLLEAADELDRWHQVARRYLQAARTMHNRRLVQLLETRIAAMPQPLVSRHARSG